VAEPSTDTPAITDRVRRWRHKLEHSNRALWVLAIASFLETVVIPIPIELVLIPYMAVNRQRIFLIATVTLAGCLTAAVLGYVVGLALFESLGQWMISTFGHEAAFQTFSEQFERYGFWAIIAIGVTPIPFQVAMLVAGVAGYPIALFLLAALIARGIRYYGLALLVYYLGEPVTALWQRHARTAGLVSLLVVAVVAGLAWWSGGL